MDTNPSKMINTNTTFKNIAGYENEKKEFFEIKEYLINHEKYKKIGARLPRGILITGEPGTGKTLLTKAIAGESNVPLFFITMAMLNDKTKHIEVIKNVFKEARKSSPSIIFIDEIHRMVGRYNFAFETNHQILNQLLVEMDGFEENNNLIVIATANEKDEIDKSLLRAGRFDRHIHIDLPNTDNRRQILLYHSINKNFDSDVSFEEIVNKTAGCSAADLETILNEAAILSMRNNLALINKSCLEEAVDRVVFLGIRKEKYNNDEHRNRIAIHEIGHAIVAENKNKGSVQKVSIEPTSNKGGYVKINSSEKIYRKKSDMLDMVTILLAGKAAEEVMLGESSTLSDDDVNKAMIAINRMVFNHGLFKLSYVASFDTNGRPLVISDKKKFEIEKEIENELNNCYVEAKSIISSKINLLKVILKELIKKETLNKDEFSNILNSNN